MIALLYTAYQKSILARTAAFNRVLYIIFHAHINEAVLDEAVQLVETNFLTISQACKYAEMSESNFRKLYANRFETVLERQAISRSELHKIISERKLKQWTK